MLNKNKSAQMAMLFVLVAVFTVIGHYYDRIPVPNVYVFGMYVYGVAAVVAFVIVALFVIALLWRHFGWPMGEMVNLAVYAACGKALGEIVALSFQRPFSPPQPYAVAMIGLVMVVGYVMARLFGDGRYVLSHIIAATAYCLFCDYVLLGVWGIKHGQGLRFFSDSYPEALSIYSIEGILLMMDILLLINDFAMVIRLSAVGILMFVSNGVLFIASCHGGNRITPMMRITVIFLVIYTLMYAFELLLTLIRERIKRKNEEAAH
ncbi:MAG: hypothetical protein K5837_03800 [Candidatus Saccharibacteria bacterium]|nr:hypothetical protein [Candidatus Saccharibacteria bacterium]